MQTEKAEDDGRDRMLAGEYSRPPSGAVRLRKALSMIRADRAVSRLNGVVLTHAFVPDWHFTIPVMMRCFRFDDRI